MRRVIPLRGQNSSRRRTGRLQRSLDGQLENRARARLRTYVCIRERKDRWRFSFSPRGRNKFLSVERSDHNGALASLHVKLERTSILSRTVPGIWSALAPAFHEEIILRARRHAVVPWVSNEPLQHSVRSSTHYSTNTVILNGCRFFLSFSLPPYRCVLFLGVVFLPPTNRTFRVPSTSGPFRCSSDGRKSCAWNQRWV